MAEQDEHQQHRGGFVELFGLEEECGANAEKIARSDAQKHQHGHVEDAVAQGPHSRDDERPDRIEDRRTRQDEQEEFEVHPERRCRRGEAHAHRRVDEDGDAENQTDPEAVAHVANHGLHVHAGAVAHLMRHVVRYRYRGCFPHGLLRLYGGCGVSGVWLADVRGQHLACTVKAAFVDLVVQRFGAGDSLIVLDRRAP